MAERVGSGLSYKEVASETGLSPSTVRHYTREVAGKLEGEPYTSLRPQTAVILWWQRTPNPT